MTPHAPLAATLVGFDIASSARLRHEFEVYGILRAQELGEGVVQSLEPEALEAMPAQPLSSVFVLGDGIAPVPEAVARLRLAATAARILVLSQETSESAILATLRAGADGYLEATSEPERVAAAVRSLARGELALSPLATRRLVESLTRPVPSGAPESLSHRERQVFDLLVDGLRYREIGERLFISLETVRSHVRRIYRKLAVSSRAELTARWVLP